MYAPDPATLISAAYLPWGGNNKTDQRDVEIFNRTNPQDYRSAMGVNALYNIGNFTVSCEYSEVVRDSNYSITLRNDGTMDTTRGDKTSALPIGDDPFVQRSSSSLSQTVSVPLHSTDTTSRALRIHITEALRITTAIRVLFLKKTTGC
jgi:hypothetical protein